MSKRDALRALSSKFPAPPEVRQILQELSKKEDHVVAIVASALTESFLQRALLSRLHSKDSSLHATLFKNRGPLSDFHSKILIGEAFGVISRSQALEMHRIKAIRNVFAHAVTPVTFETAEIAKEVDEFIMHNAMKEESLKWAVAPAEPTSRKAIYLLMAHLSCIIIDHHQKEITGEFIMAYDV